MSFLTSLLVICLFICLAIIIMFFVKANRGSDQGEIVRPMWLVAMITSDWHIEPWYSTGGGSKNNWDPSKIDDWSIDATINCDGVGTKRGDTPIGVVNSAIKEFVKGIPKSQRLFFFTGDTFSHDLKETNPNIGIEKTIMYKVFDKKQGLLKYFEPKNIFYTVGNHGGKTDEAFWQKDGVSEAWAQSLVDNGIYTPTGPDDIFWECGYYKKHLPNSTIDIICFNSILYSIVDGHDGCNNCECQDKQISRLIYDLKSLPEGRTVYILTHYPIDSDDVVYKRFIWDKITTKYQKVIDGIFTGHTHTPLTSLDTWESKKGTAHAWNVPSIYWRDTDDVSSYIKVVFPLNKPIVIGQTDVKHVKCKNKKTSELEWV
jgi:hypothetical protein